jgi:hypothetical protein
MERSEWLEFATEEEEPQQLSLKTCLNLNLQRKKEKKRKEKNLWRKDFSPKPKNLLANSELQAKGVVARNNANKETSRRFISEIRWRRSIERIP